MNHMVNPRDSQGSSPSGAGASRPVCKDWEQLFEEWTEFLYVSISFSVESVQQYLRGLVLSVKENQT